MAERRLAPFWSGVLGLAAVLVVGAVLAAAAWPSVREVVGRLRAAAGEDPPPDTEASEDGATLVRDAHGNRGLRLSAEAIQALRVEPVEVRRATQPRPLPPQIGTLNYDNDRLFTIRSRFGGELAEIRTVPDTGGPVVPTRQRPLRFGDKVKQGDLLAVVWSKDLGAAKATLVDAVCSLRLSQDTLARQNLAYREGALSLATYKATERQVQADSNAVLTAERTLRMWKLTSDEIAAIKAEANVIHDQKKARSADREMNWARVEIRVPRFCDDPNRELVVLEKNTNLNDMVDPINSPPLFKIADLSRLQIWVHPPEEYLPLLRERLQKPGPNRLRWQVRFQSEPANTPPLELDVVQIAPSLEPNQHTPMVIGYLDNPAGKYLIGQFVTATIFMPPDPDTVEMPTDALNEVEGQALVFVQDPERRREFTLRRVAVARRFKDVTFVRTRLTPEEEQTSREEVQRGRRPIQPLLPGERVVTRGVVEMTAALEELVSRARAERRAG